MSGPVGRLALGAGGGLALAGTLLWLRVAVAAAPARRARRLSWAVFAAACLAVLALQVALLTHDTGVSFVADNGGRDVPAFYTVTSMWSAQEGSVLLWLLVLAGYGALLARSRPVVAAAAHPWAVVVVGVVTVFFFALSCFAANPFPPVHPVPGDGPGPNPLLRAHPAMGVHPPLLYAGYVGMVVPFAYAVAGLVRPDAGRGWMAGWMVEARRWTLVAWSLLTAGILVGAWWSYAVLGWGGYWSWDPVENASLLPWLTSTALLHVTRVGRRRGQAGWTVGLATAGFLLVLVGTFLTRTGAVASVHSFARSPLGPPLLGFVVLAAAVVAVLAVLRGDRLAQAPPVRSPVSREAALLANVVLFVTLAAVVLTGTVFPLVAAALTGRRTAVAAGYFDRSAVPVALVALVLAGAAPAVRRGGDRVGAVARRLAVPAAAGLAAVAAVGLLSRPRPAVLAAFGAAAFALVSTGRSALAGWSLRVARSRAGMLLAHAGVAVLAVGVAASTGYTAAAERRLRVGQGVTVAGVTARLTAVERHAGSGRMTATAVLRLERDGRAFATGRPGLRYFPARDMAVSVPAIRVRPLSDVYATLSAVTQDGTIATVRLAVNPLVSLVWAGGVLTALGGVSALGRRRRAGGRTPPAPAEVPAAEPAAAR